MYNYYIVGSPYLSTKIQAERSFCRLASFAQDNTARNELEEPFFGKRATVSRGVDVAVSELECASSCYGV